MKADLDQIKHLSGKDSAHQSSFDALSIENITGLQKTGKKGIHALKRAVTSEVDYRTLRDDVRKLGVPFVKAFDKLKSLVAVELEHAKEHGWRGKVVDDTGHVADLGRFDGTMLNKLKEIYQDSQHGRQTDHGNTVLSGNNGTCKHWRLGDQRIFGTVDAGKFTLIGTGHHSGKGNSNYKVALLSGGTCTATTG